MKRKDLARALAERQQMKPEEAQDQFDRLMHAILKSLRQGHPAEMPGIGKLTAKIRPPVNRRLAAIPRTPRP